ncbi:MAG: hypothetical protein K2Z80_31170 [Xanthobacteraceae bacterium]|nr:hypothetical protein [Xanthobacteraceae bacterium]
MRKLVVVFASLAALGFVAPLTNSAAAEDGVSVRIGHGGGHRGNINRGHRNFVVRDHGRRAGWRDQHARGSRIMVGRGHSQRHD